MTKVYEAALQKVVEVQNGLRSRLRGSRGQNTVEYLMMLFVIVAVVAAIGGLMKAFMPQFFEQIKQKILGSAATI